MDNFLFDYQISSDGKCCDIKSQKSIYYIVNGKKLNFDNYNVSGKMDLSRMDVRLLMKQIYGQKFADKKEDRAIGALMGLAVGDALGAPLEFLPLQYNKIILKDMMGTDSKVDNKFGLKAGQWTDDTSMALCLCDSLLIKKKFDPIDSMIRYLNWWYNGYNNAFIYDNDRQNKHSVGLGGNISLSFERFLKYGEPYTKSGDEQTSGNGSLMRLAPVAIAYHKDVNKAQSIAKKSSYVTHRGHEASECCALLVYILVIGINTGNKKYLDDLGETFMSRLKSVNCLARSQIESNNDPDRNWNWKNKNYKYSPSRSKQQPGYIGSYSMDALAMALHCFYTTNDFESCLIKAVNLCGDADSVGAIAGQIAGAFYGVSNIPLKWIDMIHKWDGGGTISYRASKLYHSEIS